MDLTQLFGKRLMVADGLRLPVSRHFNYSTFAVRGRYENQSHLGAFVCPATPGTGFFVRNTESHSYRRFVAACRKMSEQNLFTLLLRREPNFDKIYNQINDAFASVKDEKSRQILSSYQNVVGLAKEEEQLQRIVRAIKDKMHGNPDKALVSVLTHYKSSIASLERDVRSAQINYSKLMSPERADSWARVVEAFHLLVDSRRVWSVFLNDNSPSYMQVFFDMGIFDYIQSPGDTPVMRDYRGIHYYLYPDGMVEAHSNTDFCFHPWNEMEFVFNVVDISTLAVRPQFNSHSRKRKSSHHTHDAISSLYGASRAQVVGEIYNPSLNLRFFVNHTGPAEDFVKALNDYKMSFGN